MAHSHVALDARRADSRRRMWIALAINAGTARARRSSAASSPARSPCSPTPGTCSPTLGAIALGLFAATMAARPAGPRRTFGFQRTEVLAALVNGVALVAIGVVIVIAAIGRLSDPPGVEGAGVVALGVVGLAGNLAATWVLARGGREDLNLEGVLRHSAADALGSVGVIVSGAVILTTGWDTIDPLASLAIAALILASSWRLIAEPVNVLMEAAPARLDPERVGRDICSLDHVREVHELHLWTVTSGFEALAAHVVVDRGADRDLVRRTLEVMLAERFGIEHTTLQMEEEAGRELLEVEPRAEVTP